MNNKASNSSRSVLTVFTAGAFFFYSFIQMTLFSTEAMKDYFMNVLSINNTADFGSFAGTFLYGTVIFLIPVGLLLDKFSVRKTILSFILIDVLCVLGLSYTTNATTSMIFRFMTGIAHCVAFMAPFRLAPRWFESRHLALVSGLLVAFAVFGGWVSGAPLLGLIQEFGGETTMLINTSLGVVIFILALIFIKDFPEGYVEKSSTAEIQSIGQGLKLAAMNKQNWLAGLYIGLLNLAVLLLGAMWGTTYLRIVNPEFSEATYTGIIGMIFIGTIIGSPLSGWISDKLKSRKKVMIGSGLLSLVVILLIIFPLDTNAGLFYVLFLLLGLITAAQSIGYPVIGESNEDKVLGTANGLSAVVLMGMGAIGQPLFGKLVEIFGGNAEAFQKAIWIMPIAFVLAIICVSLLRETFKKN